MVTAVSKVSMEVFNGWFMRMPFPEIIQGIFISARLLPPWLLSRPPWSAVTRTTVSFAFPDARIAFMRIPISESALLTDW